MKRSGKAWLPWLLIGVVSAFFALFLTLREELAYLVVGIAVAIWAAGRGLTSLYVAWRVGETPGRRWALLVEGAFSLAIAVLVLVVPEAGGRLLRYTLGGYFAITGVTTLAFAWSVHRSTRQRIRALVSREESIVPAEKSPAEAA